MIDWENVYKTNGVIQEKPSHQIIELVSLFKNQKVEKILDLGCGTGRHVKFLAEQGFCVIGIDNSNEAIKIARESLNPDNSVNLIISDISRVPLSTNFFDAIICSQVIQHTLKEQREMAISEIKRVLKPKGILFLRTISRKQKVFGLGEQVEPFTFLNIPHLPDGDVPHHYFSKEELIEFFDDFKILKLDEISHSPVKNDFWTQGLEELVLLAIKQ